MIGVRHLTSATPELVVNYEIGSRVTAAMYRLNERLVTVRYSPVVQVIPATVGLDNNVAGSKIWRHRIADAAYVDHSCVPNVSVQRLVCVAHADQVCITSLNELS